MSDEMKIKDAIAKAHFAWAVIKDPKSSSREVNRAYVAALVALTIAERKP